MYRVVDDQLSHFQIAITPNPGRERMVTAFADWLLPRQMSIVAATMERDKIGVLVGAVSQRHLLVIHDLAKDLEQSFGSGTSAFALTERQDLDRHDFLLLLQVQPKRTLADRIPSSVQGWADEVLQDRTLCLSDPDVGEPSTLIRGDSQNGPFIRDELLGMIAVVRLTPYGSANGGVHNVYIKSSSLQAVLNPSAHGHWVLHRTKAAYLEPADD